MATIELTKEQKIANDNSHDYTIIDDCWRCFNCEIGSWNGWKQPCSN